MTSKRYPTLKDIAKRADVSASTVSAVLNHKQVERGIPEKTAQKVLKVARALGYVPNLAARRLRDRKNGVQRIVVAILTSYEAPLRLVSQALQALEEVINERAPSGFAFSVRIEMFHAGRLKELPDLIEGTRFNGVIITNTVAADDDFLARARLRFPVVLLGRSIPGYSSVSEKPGELGERVAEVFASIGRRKLAVLCPRLLTQATKGRLTAFMDAAFRITGEFPVKIECLSLSVKGGYEGLVAYLGVGGHCDGLFAVTDSLAIGAYHAIKENGQTIPTDIAVIGMGDHEASAFLDPPLTSFSHVQYALTRKAAENLLAILWGEQRTPMRVEVPVVGRLRESTGHRAEPGGIKTPVASRIRL